MTHYALWLVLWLRIYVTRFACRTFFLQLNIPSPNPHPTRRSNANTYTRPFQIPIALLTPILASFSFSIRLLPRCPTSGSLGLIWDSLPSAMVLRRQHDFLCLCGYSCPHQCCLHDFKLGLRLESFFLIPRTGPIVERLGRAGTNNGVPMSRLYVLRWFRLAPRQEKNARSVEWRGAGTKERD
ncbi:hypothetical protein BDU57DRAFT_509557 [Ampelomyces quisqualis]|uniref:Uncharacterized protein n=1 Tax=Ampelomyces quisqualis TaxID=50730 RepID=A0A6A5QZ26_AMPQU|nr:hypothetical protein BDU57DRAFT_509557 [Ampelomyces quisqualis]